MKSGFWDKLIRRLDRLDKDSLQTQFVRLASERGILDAIFEAIREGMVVLDSAGSVKYANRGAEKMLGFSRESAFGQPFSKYISGVDWEDVMDLDEKEWQQMGRREIEIGYPENRFVEFYMVPMATVKDDIEGVVVMLRDVTQDRKSVSKTLESNRLEAITLLAARVAHEIGNPLNSIDIHLQLLQREIEHLPDEERANFGDLADIVRKEVARLDNITHQFLRALRSSEPDRQPVQLDGLLEETLKFLKYEVESRGILIEREWPNDLPTLSLDATQVKQAFFNIIKNSVQALSHDGIIKISIDLKNRFVRVSFSDNGPGISMDNLGSICEPYETTKLEGSGLGLMIVQRILRDHGGRLEIRSEPGCGSTFTLVFPRTDVRPKLLAVSPQETDSPAEKASKEGDLDG